MIATTLRTSHYMFLLTTLDFLRVLVELKLTKTVSIQEAITIFM